MIGVRLLAKQTVTKILREASYERVEDGDLDGHTYWKTPWGFHFYVPEHGPDKRTPEHVLHEILADAAKSRKPKLKVVR